MPTKKRRPRLNTKVRVVTVKWRTATKKTKERSSGKGKSGDDDPIRGMSDKSLWWVEGGGTRIVRRVRGETSEGKETLPQKGEPS